MFLRSIPLTEDISLHYYLSHIFYHKMNILQYKCIFLLHIMHVESGCTVHESDMNYLKVGLLQKKKTNSEINFSDRIHYSQNKHCKPLTSFYEIKEISY